MVLLDQGCGASPSARTEFQVTNTETEPLTYTITFTFLDNSGRAMDNTRQTVANVAPGRTVQRTVEPGRGEGGRVRITQVRAVPADEAPATSAECPRSGMRVTADDGDAAMGLRAVGLHLTNCGTGVVRVNGYPSLQLLDETRKPVTGVRILDGTAEISTGGPDTSPSPVTLQPGESASASLMWRNTTMSGTPVNAPYVRVKATPGAPPVVVTPELDLGTTGKLGVSPWSKDKPRTR
ncbi:DUF4232 domain-containing protein [Streptomyces stramineus]